MRQIKQWTLLIPAIAMGCIAWAANPSGANAIVTVHSRGPGIEKIVPMGLDFHVTAENLPAHSRCHVDFVARPPQQLVEPDPSLVSLRPGETVTYRTTNPENQEDEISGKLTLFRVDVMIGAIGEKLEEKVGAKILRSPFSHAGKRHGVLMPVKIRCIPANRPGNEKILLRFPAGHLLVKSAGVYKEAKTSYRVDEIGKLRFFLQGLQLSSEKRDFAITATHSGNGCHDTATYTVVGKPTDIEGSIDKDDDDDRDDAEKDDDDDRDDAEKDDDDDDRDDDDKDDDDDDRDDDDKDDDDDDDRDDDDKDDDDDDAGKDDDDDAGKDDDDDDDDGKGRRPLRPKKRR